MSRTLRSLLIFSFIFSAQQLFAQLAVPELSGVRVHDKANVLSVPTVQNLESVLKQHEDSTGNQIVILIINSLQGESIEDYSLRVAEKSRLGSAQNDNGVLLLVAVEDHKMRIETGQGLEGVLTDALSSQIIRNEMAPNFRRGDYDAGVLLGVNAIIRAIAGEYKNDGKSNSGRKGINPVFIILIVFAVFSILSRFFKGRGGNSGGRGWSSGSGWFVGGGGFGGGSGGGGGFSGGGGSFGGGGSSGSW